MTTLSPPLTERQHRALERVLEGLEKLLPRADAQYGRQRRHDRKHYRGVVSIFTYGTQPAIPPQTIEGLPVGWTYSLSQGGAGFVSLEEIPQEPVLVGLHMPNGTVKWLPGNVVRRREIPEEAFWEYGVAFGVPKEKVEI
jgi:hypothetical protein